MPIYEYICQDCQGRFECFFMSRSDNQGVICSHCGGRKVQRIFSTFGVGGHKDSNGSASSGCRTCSTKTCSTCR